MKKPTEYWTQERCAEEAQKYSSRSSFKNGSGTAYRVAIKKEWLNEICAHITPSRKPDGYWTKERCKEQACKYTSRTEFNNSSSKAYRAASVNGWLTELCRHMPRSSKPPNYWTKAQCEKEAQKYTRRNEFLKESASAFRIAQRNGWLDDVCSHMQYINSPPGYWTLERCRKEAKKYRHRNELNLNARSAYVRAQENGWLDEICSHMEYQVLPRNYWTKELVLAEAKKFETRSEFSRDSASAYAAAIANKWLDAICGHMITVDYGWKHCLYAILNKRLNKAYVGLTRQSFEIRMEQHRSSKNTTHSREIAQELDTDFIRLTDYDFLVEEVAEKEKEFFDIYVSKGYELLNDEKRLGAIGSRGASWNREKCKKEALKFKTTVDFRNGSRNAYFSALRNGWLKEISKHLKQNVRSTKGANYWTKDVCLIEAKKYRTLKDFRTKSTPAYAAAHRNGWLDELKSNFEVAREKTPSWNKESCTSEALNYSKRLDFKKSCHGAYSAANKNGWLDDVCSHMQYIPPGYWTLERCREEARKYESKVNFKRDSGGAYSAARKNEWMTEVCGHMAIKSKPVGYWTLEKCQEEGRKFQSKKDFLANSGGAYAKAKRNGWLDEICNHMIPERAPRGFWNDKKRCVMEAMKYHSKSEFKNSSRGAFASARKNGWIDEICSHMKKMTIEVSVT